MLDGALIFDAMNLSAGQFATYMSNLAEETGEIEEAFFKFIVPAIGLFISATGVIDLIKMRNPRNQGKASLNSALIRFCVGPATIQLVAFMTAISESIFGAGTAGHLSEGAAVAHYAAGASNETDPAKIVIMTIFAFLTMIGWIAALRAMMAFARAGNPAENGFQQFRTGASRLIAATFLCMSQFVVNDMYSSITGNSTSSGPLDFGLHEVVSPPSDKATPENLTAVTSIEMWSMT